jgi:hypothetical protein
MVFIFTGYSPTSTADRWINTKHLVIIPISISTKDTVRCTSCDKNFHISKVFLSAADLLQPFLFLPSLKNQHGKDWYQYRNGKPAKG